MSLTAYIAMGSNLGSRKRTLIEAMRMLAQRPGILVRRHSDFLETDPVGPPGQDKYLNTALELETTLAPAELLAVLQEVETALGRDRSKEVRWGPRTCDLDILLIDDLVLDSPELTVPHPRLHERTFMLRPLVQIAPDAVHPVLNKTVRQLLEELEGRK